MRLERYGHGGDLWTATEAYGRPVEEWLDYSSNMNPWGPPDVVGHLVKEHWRDIARYPDPAVRRLRSKLSEAYRIPAESILVGNGAAELIDLAVRVLQPEETVLARPSFSEYEEAAHKAGRRVRSVFLSRDQRFELTDVKDLVGHGGTVFLGHPNNPTGRLIPIPVLDELRESGTRMILDEAFMDFLPDESEFSYIRRASESMHIQVIRSMTKFYAIPGIRLGFMVAHPDLIRRLQEVQTQWSVNFLAQLIGEAVLDEHAYADRTRAWLTEERSWLVSELGKIGLTVFPSDVNFLLVALPEELRDWNVRRLQQAMAERGIMIRDASLFEGLDPSYFRLAIRLRQDNERLLKALKECLS
ncbi:threonine-phosphate decarboxylase CobD [Cohnella lupini]|uniref:threonine-phosphate decarboxylase n=1 Tax=Cohnella lupini TaxID=1294267 RepID=A0A3D9I9V8_9BACL|nr:threonine-phosphate decarboxylase CobD [Cohnella lupini]RED58507.1 L-threonine O-3-phosphate decarboxylase [Cohnella lupini]